MGMQADGRGQANSQKKTAVVVLDENSKETLTDFISGNVCLKAI